MTNPSSIPEIPDSVYDGSEPFFSFFSQAQVALSTLRLSLEERVVSQTSDLASQMETVRRTFQHNGKFAEAIQDVLRISTQLVSRIQGWEREVQSREQAKQFKSGAQLQRIKTEVSQVRLKCRMTERILSKLEIVLHQLEAEEAEKVANSSTANQEHNEAASDAFEVASVVAQFQESLLRFVGQGLTIRAQDAGRPVPNSKNMEQAWDEPLFLVVAQWRFTVQQPSMLILWFIPKFKDIADRIDSVTSSLRWFVSGSDSKMFLEFYPNHYPNSDWPQSHSVQQYLQLLAVKRFGGNQEQIVALSGRVPAKMIANGSVTINPLVD